jgi:hypothetical protein
MFPIPLRLRKVLIRAVHEVPPDLEMPKGGCHKQTTILGKRFCGGPQSRRSPPAGSGREYSLAVGGRAAVASRP